MDPQFEKDRSCIREAWGMDSISRAWSSLLGLVLIGRMICEVKCKYEVILQDRHSYSQNFRFGASDTEQREQIPRYKGSGYLYSIRPPSKHRTKPSDHLSQIRELHYISLSHITFEARTPSTWSSMCSDVLQHNSTTTQHPHDTNTDIHPSRYNPTVPKNDAMTATSSFVRTKEAVCPAAFRWPTAGGKLGSELSDVVGSLRSYRLCLGRLQVDHYCPSAQIPTMLTSSRATVHTQARSYVEHGTQSCIPCCMLQCFPIDNTNHTSHSTAQRYQYPQFTSDHTTVPDPLPSEVPSCHQATNVKQLRSSRVDPSRN
eukprot:GHVQ01027111.1.p1 GENE.GHVQ01027111.1~~GHVQ01027111.1.p1  ORF type:complete len:315 (+),score=22.63 GHVQ01027111.1:429-1373(+)